MTPDANENDGDAGSGADVDPDPDPEPDQTTGRSPTPTGFRSFEAESPGPDWLEPEDEEILAVLREDHNFAPSHAAEADVCRGPVASHRCRELAKRGLLKKVATGMYDVTDLGERFLDGEVSLEELAAEADEVSE
ncbi:hypothetical protein SAMN05444422_104117 [Halobiforma haloterrestris]|uniref:Uncharacterized protein n=1 Tax=Natronobacterium haloterrestre TaxID=148448 RepID=A0A1I1G5I5_NATHA|nr:hypothetical protein [Halobiforma haloterrestris]SFC07079.1 hypothetical protein SAMN05444422_104117 [Halobiforma haloterrestris]